MQSLVISYDGTSLKVMKDGATVYDVVINGLTNAVSIGSLTSSGNITCGGTTTTNALTVTGAASMRGINTNSNPVTCGGLTCSGDIRATSNAGLFNSVSANSMTTSSLSLSGTFTPSSISTGNIQCSGIYMNNWGSLQMPYGTIMVTNEMVDMLQIFNYDGVNGWNTNMYDASRAWIGETYQGDYIAKYWKKYDTPANFMRQFNYGINSNMGLMVLDYKLNAWANTQNLYTWQGDRSIDDAFPNLVTTPERHVSLMHHDAKDPDDVLDAEFLEYKQLIRRKIRKKYLMNKFADYYETLLSSKRTYTRPYKPQDPKVLDAERKCELDAEKASCSTMASGGRACSTMETLIEKEGSPKASP